MEKVLIIDSNSLMNRAYFALPPMSTKDGLYTNAIYGYINMVTKLDEEIGFDHIVAAFDRKAPTFRHLEYKDYKAGRKGMDDELAMQLPVMKELLDAFSITILEKDGYEADDIIGTMAREGEADGMEVYILSGDRDTLQLATDKTKVIITQKGITEKAVYDKNAFIEEFGVTPTQFIDVKGLMGDKSDNIPGVPGIGEKTAFELIKTYGSIEGVYENIESITKKKQKENLIQYKDDAFFSRKLATIFCQVPDIVSLDDVKDRSHYDEEKIREIYIRLQFRSLLKKMDEKAESNGETKENTEVKADDFIEIRTSSDMDKLIESIRKARYVSLDFTFNNESMLTKREILKVYAVSEDFRSVIDFKTVLEDTDAFIKLKNILQDRNIVKISYDVKNAYSVMKMHGIEFDHVDFDVLIATYIIEPEKGQSSLKDLIFHYLMKEIRGEGDALKITETSYLKELSDYLKEKVEEYGEHDLMYNVEMPLTNVLSDMELEGIRVDRKVLDELGVRFSSEIEKTGKEIYSLSGEEFNINSPKQLGTILFDKLDLPHGKKTKTGWSTNQEVLDSLMDKHPIVEKVQYYRQLTKMYSTYIEGLKNAIEDDSRIHSNFNQTLAVTGRLSSTEPNLQNIPIKYEMGRELRKAFVPHDDESVMLSSDYSQIELRVLAHIADDKNMQDAFKNNIDIHTKTASEVFGKKPEDVTPKDRSNAKAVNFGIVYGISDFALGNDLKITRKEAREYIDRYYDRYPGIKAYFDRTIADAKQSGLVTTMMGRRRHINEIKASNKIVQAAGVRLAMNSPIQGSAADIIKAAMVKVHDALLKEGLKSRIILQVHDEIILNVRKDELEKVEKLVDHEMENAVNLNVTLKSSQSVGSTWFEA